MQNRFEKFDAVFYQETILSSGVFRRETASGFYPFGDATALAGEGGVSDVVWLIQASASNHKPKGRFFWFVYAKGIPKEPSLWFVQGQLVYHFPKKIGTA